MTRTRSLLCAAVLTLALLPSAADAQDGPAYARDREVTVTGTVADNKVGQNPWSNFRESHLALEDGDRSRRRLRGSDRVSCRAEREDQEAADPPGRWVSHQRRNNAECPGAREPDRRTALDHARRIRTAIVGRARTREAKTLDDDAYRDARRARGQDHGRDCVHGLRENRVTRS